MTNTSPSTCYMALVSCSASGRPSTISAIGDVADTVVSRMNSILPEQFSAIKCPICDSFRSQGATSIVSITPSSNEQGLFIMTIDGHKGWYTARKLPHLDAPHTLQFITFRLADALPQPVLRELRKQAYRLPADQRARGQREGIEHWLDQGLGSCVLEYSEMAEVLRDALTFHHGSRYQLMAWCIMPNHVHVVIEPTYSLPRIVQGWKTYSARWALMNGFKSGLTLPCGQFWMRGYWDRYIRDARHYQAAVHYVHQNPVKAGLCEHAEDWRWSSAYEAT